MKVVEHVSFDLQEYPGETIVSNIRLSIDQDGPMLGKAKFYVEIKTIPWLVDDILEKPKPRAQYELTFTRIDGMFELRVLTSYFTATKIDPT
jgi:hypothetical protein